MPAILHSKIKRCHIRHGNIHIVGIKDPVKQGSLATLADARIYPGACKDGLQEFHHHVVVSGSVFHSQVVPIPHIRPRLTEIPVLHHHLARIDQRAEFIEVCRIGAIIGCVAFGDQHHRRLGGQYRNKNTLNKTSLSGLSMIKRLPDFYLHGFSEKAVGAHGLHLYYRRELLQVICQDRRLYLQLYYP